ncbi:MAG: hypothetical protein KAJ49_10525 [Arcobacteraceae bacterium]|nr:hypothetical protein [Arcobacteraceae bacterium]
MRFIVFLFLIIFSANATEILVSDKNIRYQEILDYDNLSISTTEKRVRCEMFDKNNLLNTTYQAKHYILKGKPICIKDVQVVKKNKIRYDFGNIVIERNGKVIGENKKYIRVKNIDGTIDKIYKNGQLK